MDERVREADLAPARDKTGFAPPARRTRVRWPLLLLLLFAAVIVLLVVHPWGGPPQGGRARAQTAQPVREATVTKGDMPITMDGLGTVTPVATVTVQTQINGLLMEVGFKEGQTVKKGDFLAQIDPRPYQVALEQAQGQLAHDQALLQQAQTDLARYQTLLRQDSISRQQAEDQRFLVLQYQGSIRTDQALIDTQKLNLVYCRIVSPISGRVGLRLVDPGNYVQTTSTTGLVVITQMQPITIIFPLPEDDLPQVMARLHAGATLPVTAYNHSNTTRLASGTLEAVDSVIDTTTGTVKLRATFSNEDDALFPSQFVNARLLVDTLHGTTLVPAAAVQNGAPGAYVWLVKPDSTVTVRVVKVGPTDGEHTAILSGLNPGDKVVIDGMDRLREGAKVEVPAASPAAAAPAGSRQHGGSQGHHRREQQ